MRTSSARRSNRLLLYVLLKLGDEKGLLGDDGFDQITDGHHANDLVTVDDRQMTDAFFGHHRKALLDPV